MWLVLVPSEEVEMGSSDGDGPGSSTKQMERQRSQSDVSIFQSIVICIILENVFLESFQAHIEDDTGCLKKN